ncbi:type II toxin-antitoxin system RelE family toxin [Lonepinella sp. BR2357]|uniref:type II toxin-antitoxin system RelE family toxin n=1 Tax=Lonepinella sp. BR2357 TaxID=3434549 RepID=UPI003F6DAB5D
MLAIRLSKDAAAFLEKIPLKHAKQIVAKIDLLANNPLSIQSKQLTGYPILRRIKAGEYRIIYQIENDVLEIHVLRIGKRNDAEVYRHLGKLI